MWVDYVYIIPVERTTLTKEETTILALRKKLRTVRHYNCTGTPDKLSVIGSAKHNKKLSGNFWWRLGKIEKGQYRCVIRVRVDDPAKVHTISLDLVDHTTKRIVEKRPLETITNIEYEEVEIPFEYDGTYHLQLSDWSSPGMWVDYVYLVPEKGTVRDE